MLPRPALTATQWNILCENPLTKFLARSSQTNRETEKKLTINWFMFFEYFSRPKLFAIDIFNV